MVSMAAACAVLDVIRHNDLQCNALNVSNHLRERLAALGQRHAIVGEARGAGLLIGLELLADRAMRTTTTAQAAQVVNGLRQRQVLLSATGPHANVLKIRPPLVFQHEHADLLVERLDEVLAAVS